MTPIHLLGVFPIGPENFMCALFEWEESSRYLPVWLPPIEGALLAARLEDWAPRRPGVHDVLADVIDQTSAEVNAIELSSYHEGVFVATLTLDNGAEIDMRTSDALLLGLVMDVQIEADETVLQHASIHINGRDAAEYFGIEIEDNSDVDEIPPETLDTDGLDAAAFEAFMRELGVDAADFPDMGEDDPDTGPKPSS
ncbi:hypothetical protein CGLAU_06230 [Corynebacterium glaucum]|uniref:BFN domain-containing protein n=1 Tax=Corynebacterium glaucum TaxID=187491 RepID=A0A1Q2HWJ6_9CORY|nr:bifunctional nuclease family protein [Corynebacterium glaucum]AQQ15209.1 hypothetical protein CGLAU_06230 [Corynebacterium glaucum]WJZ07706.1 hypothetical protein CGLAUT_06085 [Corynebacterium glaucum]